MHGQADPSPVTDLDGVRTVQLADVVDVVSGRDGQAHRLRHQVDQFLHGLVGHG